MRCSGCAKRKLLEATLESGVEKVLWLGEIADAYSEWIEFIIIEDETREFEL